ncbi:DUF3194 domain-containing protein [Halapricum desulfuricans]|uniref:DUF3194 domain-containing protein n=1 Tax=Halapricum desulfuricans TaxID=2841257 RepID=A0A897MYK8_9EURY|nr:DUF3194 domain-containing protein [Halapricum desulfuricans]QSG05547.1 Uncharacterized protein HSR121_1200 [Halapricum desulfuricans]
MVEDSEVVKTAADAAENVIFSRSDRSVVDDLDITVTFEEGVLEVDVYLDVADDRIDDRQLADDAALAARAAVDELFS